MTRAPAMTDAEFTLADAREDVEACADRLLVLEMVFASRPDGFSPTEQPAVGRLLNDAAGLARGVEIAWRVAFRQADHEDLACDASHA